MERKRIKPDGKTFEHLLSGFYSEGKFEDVGNVVNLMNNKEGNVEQAKKLFENMVKRGFKPDCDCHYTLVYCLCKGSAFSFAKESIAKNWVPNFATMMLLVEGLVSIGKVAEARVLIGQMKEKFTVNQDRWGVVEDSLPP